MEPFKCLHDFLSTMYSNCLDFELSTAIETDSYPVLTWVNDDLRNVPSMNEARGAMIRDDEIGLCLFVLKYSVGVDVEAQVAQALRFRSLLQPRQGGQQEFSDELGEWKVAINWLVDQVAFDKWVDRISVLRQETAHFEEVSVDAIVDWDSNWSASIREHGLPRLLFHVREVMRKSNINEMVAWSDADTAIANKVRELPEHAPSNIQRRYADSIVETMDRLLLDKEPSEESVVEVAKPLKHVKINNFRNISSLDFSLGNDDEAVSANVVQGPNGSGKSSLYEAISIAAGGVSSRYVEYVTDKNITQKKTSNSYVEVYLKSISSTTSKPEVFIDGASEGSLSLVEPEKAQEALRELSGTFLSQAYIDSLVTKEASDLGAEIAGGYSNLATDLYDFCSDKLRDASDKRTAFNSRWGLRANVKKGKTAKYQIARSVISRSTHRPNTIISWCDFAGFLKFDALTEIHDVGMQWENVDNLVSQASEALSSSENIEEIREVLKVFFNSTWDLSNKTKEVLSRVERKKEVVYSDFLDHLNLYSAWSARVEKDSLDDVSGERTELRGKVSEIGTKLEKLTRDGETLKQRQNQISGAVSFHKEHSDPSNEHNCPVCDTNLESRGGVSLVLQELLSEGEAKLETLRIEYRNLLDDRNTLQRRLVELGEENAPLTDEQISKMRDTLSVIFGVSFSIDAFIANEGEVAELNDVVMHLTRGFTGFEVAPEETTTELVDGLTNKIHNAFQEFSEVSESPEAWEGVQKQLMASFVGALLDHLPKTIQAMWLEISRNMMPAPWQYPGRTQFNIEQRRGRPEARVVVRGERNSPLAAHVLNGAEVHNLALSWFLVRYLTTGRFKSSFLVLDDPAQQMDQPTFRDMCRLFDTVLRLHRFHHIPLTLVIFLHQDERALDAARATNGLLHLLRWNRGTPTLFKSLRLRSEATYIPSVKALDVVQR